MGTLHFACFLLDGLVLARYGDAQVDEDGAGSPKASTISRRCGCKDFVLVWELRNELSIGTVVGNTKPSLQARLASSVRFRRQRRAIRPTLCCVQLYS